MLVPGYRKYWFNTAQLAIRHDSDQLCPFDAVYLKCLFIYSSSLCRFHCCGSTFAKRSAAVSVCPFLHFFYLSPDHLSVSLLTWSRHHVYGLPQGFFHSYFIYFYTVIYSKGSAHNFDLILSFWNIWNSSHFWMIYYLILYYELCCNLLMRHDAVNLTKSQSLFNTL